MNKANYRRGGLFMIPFIVIAMVIAIISGAPPSALISISIFGFGTALVLILVGDRSERHRIDGLDL